MTPTRRIFQTKWKETVLNNVGPRHHAILFTVDRSNLLHSWFVILQPKHLFEPDGIASIVVDVIYGFGIGHLAKCHAGICDVLVVEEIEGPRAYMLILFGF